MELDIASMDDGIGYHDQFVSIPENSRQILSVKPCDGGIQKRGLVGLSKIEACVFFGS